MGAPLGLLDGRPRGQKEVKMKLSDLKKEYLSNPENKKYNEQMKIKRDIRRLMLDYRKKEGLTQGELAKRLGLKQQAISRLERDEINPTIEFLAKNLYEMGYELKLHKRKI